MGQQQLLLLVLSTVIVGLATVAGIQAFSENQAQATQDAITQKGVSIMSDAKGAFAKPAALGGADSTDTPKSVAKKLGYGNSATVPVDGASGNANCTIQDPPTSVKCTAPDAENVQDVTVSLAGDSLSTTFGSGNNNK
jgi:hypothetical protein